MKIYIAGQIKGWQMSNGATLEHRYAWSVGLEILLEEEIKRK
ncbi:hypothetical protein M2140_001938 [Clostridiales Family XIII bacterium PM5-7]